MSSSDEEICDHEDDNKSYRKTLQRFQEQINGYDPETSRLYEEIETTDEEDDEIPEVEEDVVFEIIESAVSDVAEVIREEKGKYTLLFDQNIDETQLREPDEEVEFEKSGDNIPYLQSYIDIYPFVKKLAELRPETKGSRLNIDNEFTVRIK